MVNSDNKKILEIIIVVILITLALSYVFFSYLPKHQREVKLNEYKKALFDSSLCQYECPLTLQNNSNQTQLLPDVDCIKQCVLTFKNETLLGSQYSNADLENDNMFKDYQALVLECRNSSTIKGIINNSAYFDCIPPKLENLKTQYSYLK